MDEFPSSAELLSTLALASARMVGMMLIFPLFTMANIAGLYAFAFSIAFSAPFVVKIYTSFLGAPPVYGATLGLLAVKELGLGFVIGTILSVPFFAVQTAGDIIDHSRSASISNVADPINSSETTTLGTYLMVVSLFYFASTGGLLILLEAVYSTYKIWPIESFVPPVDVSLPSGVGLFLTAFIKMGFFVASPILLVFIVIDVATMLVGKMAGQFPIFDLSNTFKNLAIILLLPVFMLFFSYYFETGMTGFSQIWDQLVTPDGRQ